MSGPTLIVNADDFGRSPGVNRGVITAHEQGVVTSATLMVRWPAAAAAAEYARRGSLGVGLHLDLGEWSYRDGSWRTLYEVIATQTEQAVADELSRQLARFERLVGRAPTHLDSHQHVHGREPARAALIAAGERLSIPVRGVTPGISYSGEFYGQDARGVPVSEAITVEALIGVIEALPPGVTELGCHPAADADHETMYADERLRELETLTDPRVRAAVDRCGVTLASFADVG
jgi:predicted glycoside hydrolase/deacetylase ChbG (UPF0249 family)